MYFCLISKSMISCVLLLIKTAMTFAPFGLIISILLSSIIFAPSISVCIINKACFI